jgi:hypothetical protein
VTAAGATVVSVAVATIEPHKPWKCMTSVSQCFACTWCRPRQDGGHPRTKKPCVAVTDDTTMRFDGVMYKLFVLVYQGSNLRVRRQLALSGRW